MGASVGVGALVVGTACMIALAMALTSVGHRLDEALETIKEAEEPKAKITINNATRDANAILTVSCSPCGATYSSGTLTASGGGSGFSASYTVDMSGEIDSITITEYGKDYTGIVVITPSHAGDSNAVFSTTKGNALWFNITNDGEKTIPISDMWYSVDGGTPEKISGKYTTHEYIFSGEVIAVKDISTGGSTAWSRLAINALSATKGVAL